MADAFDEHELMERIDGDIEFLEETLEILEEDSPPLLDAIRAAALSKDAAALVTPAHSLKGMLSNFCAAPAEAAAYALEKMGREERLTDVEAAADRLRQETERLQGELKSFLWAKST